MNAVEIEEAVSKLVEDAFNAVEFPYAFLEAFGNKTATLQRLRNAGKNSTNKTDVTGNGVQAVLQRNNIHMATCSGGGPDAVADLLKRLTDSPATSKHKAKFALATDGHTVHAECLNSEEPPLVCEFKELADHFGYFLELAGISTVRQIRENAFDIKATGRLNRLYVELLRNNPDWDGDERREELNHFFARLIFCFFAEDTGIFNGNALFTETVRQMSDPSGENTDFVLAEVFRAMDVPTKARDAAKLRPWAGQFPYVNGGLFGSNGSQIRKGDWFIVDGQKALVAETGDWFTPEHGERDRRLRVIFDNGTESDLLLRSLRRALNKDENSRRIVPPQPDLEEDFSDLGPLFSNVMEDGDCESGAIYVARSLSDNPFVQENRELLHKIGLTTGDPEKRVSNAKKETTYLFAAVELVAVYRLANINCKAFESLLHKFLARARIDLALADRFGGKVQPREWFLVPLSVVEEVVERIKDGSISDYLFDVESARIKRRGA